MLIYTVWTCTFTFAERWFVRKALLLSKRPEAGAGIEPAYRALQALA
jgi:hypothetical protein